MTVAVTSYFVLSSQIWCKPVCLCNPQMSNSGHLRLYFATALMHALLAKQRRWSERSSKTDSWVVTEAQVSDVG